MEQRIGRNLDFMSVFIKKISNPFLNSHFFITFATVFGAIAGKAYFFGTCYVA
jgi:hypothetical protein